MAASRSTSMPTKLLSLSVNSNGAKVVSVATMYFLPEPEAADVEAEPLEPPPQPARPRPRTAAEPPMRARNERRDMNLDIEGTPFGCDAGRMCWSHCARVSFQTDYTRMTRRFGVGSTGCKKPRRARGQAGLGDALGRAGATRRRRGPSWRPRRARRTRPRPRRRSARGPCGRARRRRASGRA